MILMPAAENPRPPHKCECVARVPQDLMDEGRDWWIGKLLEPVPEWPGETHCLHMKAPRQDVVFLMREGDFRWLTVLFTACFGKVDLKWLERVARGAERAGAEFQEERS